MTPPHNARPYLQCDVFADRPGAGNPLAVVLDAQGLDDDDMQAIARWTRLPETTFVLPPADADSSYRIRMFSPRREVPFAGHPSVGTAHAVLQAGLATPVDGVLVLDGIDVHVPKPYIYFAMAFSVMVEWLNLLMRRRAAAHRVPGAGKW